MPLMTWNRQLELGIPSIDSQHKKLVEMLNTLFDGMHAGQGKETLGGVLRGLIAYTTTHFKHEESLFTTFGYGERLAHKREHEKLVEAVLEIQAKYEAGSGALSIEVMNFLKRWLSEHILGSDKKYAPFLIAKGVR